MWRGTGIPCGIGFARVLLHGKRAINKSSVLTGEAIATIKLFFSQYFFRDETAFPRWPNGAETD
jgi:hypothetical protein